jgi:hypothetical protein
MAADGYLNAVLDDQTLEDGSDELKRLRQHKKEAEGLLREKYEYEPSIRYGGSYKKGTMNRDSYDLDLTCYFARESTAAGTSLEEIYGDVEEHLRTTYWTERKGSAIRLRSRDDLRADFHIDVVPGRFVEGKEGDVHLFQSNGDKKYLKTNLDRHIEHVCDCGVVSAIRLMKLWNVRRGVGIKTFALELLVIKLLIGRKRAGLADQLTHVLEQFRDRADSLSITDPANANNDLSGMLNDTVRWNLEHHARATLETVQRDGWEAVFGPVKKTEKAAALVGMAASTAKQPKPYYGVETVA